MIYGEVQGVGFRSQVRQQARLIGIKGWVVNKPDGTVEVLSEGEETKLQEFIRWCSRGPLGTTITKVDTDWQDYKAEFTDFTVK